MSAALSGRRLSAQVTSQTPCSRQPGPSAWALRIAALPPPVPARRAVSSTVRQRGNIMAEAIKLTETKFVYNRIPYWRRKAESMLPGTWGRKKTPLGASAYVQDEGRIPAENLKIRKVTEVDIDFDQVSQSDIGLSLVVPGFGKLKPDEVVEKGRKGQVSLLKLEVENLANAINDSPRVLAALQELSDGRVIGEVWIVVSAEIARTVTTSHSLGLSGVVQGVAITGEAKNDASSKVLCEVSEGSCFAYLPFEPKWEENMKRNRTKVIRCEDDLKGSPN